MPKLKNQIEMPDPQFVTYAFAARVLGISKPTLHRAIAAGKIPVVRVMAKPKVPRKWLDSFVKNANGEVSP